MKPLLRSGKVGALALLLLCFTACHKNIDDIKDFFDDVKDKTDIEFYALGNDNKLQKFSTYNPGKSLASTTITGLQDGETILAIDFRPATGQLYGLGSTSRIYVIDYITGKARAVSAQSQNPTPFVPAPFAPELSGTIVGFDFNPTVDRIRIVTSTGQNLRANPETGTIVPMGVDGSINGAAGATVSAVAYTNNTAGAATTELFAIDYTNDKLYKINPPNAGTLEEVGALKLDVAGEGGFDIDSKTGTALGLFAAGGKPTLFSVDLKSGKAYVLAKYEGSTVYTGIAIPTQPVAYAVSTSNALIIFDPQRPNAAAVSKPISGIQTGEAIVGIDFRPANGQLYALGSSSRLYTVNASSGAATLVASLTTTPMGGTPQPLALSGTSFGFDFNPLVDRIRIVSNTGQNLRVHPNTGATLVDSMLNPGTPSVTAAAYENNFAGTTATTLFVIDTNTDKLYKQDPPNNGTLVEIGKLGVNVNASNGFDIGGMSNTGYALLNSASNTRLYTINRASGALTSKGDFTYSVRGFTVGLGF